jgi:hypothetical protein
MGKAKAAAELDENIDVLIETAESLWKRPGGAIPAEIDNLVSLDTRDYVLMGELGIEFPPSERNRACHDHRGPSQIPMLNDAGLPKPYPSPQWREMLRAVQAIARAKDAAAAKQVAETAPMAAERPAEEKPATTPAPARDQTPIQWLTNWREILSALDIRDNMEDREKVRNLHTRYNGPILFPGQGAQPKADKAKLIEWWNHLDVEFTVGHNRDRDSQPTASARHRFGKNGQVAPEIGGSIKSRRRDRKP